MKIRFDDETLYRMFGAEDAENEQPGRLKQYFVRNKAYENLRANLPIRIIVGHKGVGKSALLRMAYNEDIENEHFAIWVRPDDLQSHLTQQSQNLNTLIDSWKKGLIDVIYRKAIEKIGRSTDEENFGPTRYTLNALLESVRNYITSNNNKVIDAAAQAIVAEFMRNQSIRIYMDDLDRGWEAKRSDILNISALLNAIRDLCGPDNRLLFRLGLRTDVYFLVRTSDESTDKIERNVIILSWSNHEILTIMAKRVANFLGKPVDDVELAKQRQSVITQELSPIIEARFKYVGKWEDAPIHRVLLSLTRRRPRDLIKLLYGGAKEAFRTNVSIITTEALRSTFAQYSNERLQDIMNEFKSELPEIGRLVHGMRPVQKERTTMQNYLYTNDKLMVKLRNLMQNNRFSFSNGQLVTAKSLAEFLYKIDFIVARRDHDNGEIARVFFDQNRYLQSQFADYGFKWEVHPAYRWALQPDDIDDIFRKLDLASED